MKRRPKCSRVYADDSLNFCLDDGEWLLPDDHTCEGPTAIISAPDSYPESIMQTRPGHAGSTAIQHPSSNAGSAGHYKKPAIAAVGILIIAGLVFGLSKLHSSRSSTVNAPLKVTPLTSSPGVERNVAFSPDGKQANSK
jgi:hypothetical protein